MADIDTDTDVIIPSINLDTSIPHSDITSDGTPFPTGPFLSII